MTDYVVQFDWAPVVRIATHCTLFALYLLLFVIAHAYESIAPSVHLDLSGAHHDLSVTSAF
jgi:hypothetical protein